MQLHVTTHSGNSCRALFFSLLGALASLGCDNGSPSGGVGGAIATGGAGLGGGGSGTGGIVGTGGKPSTGGAPGTGGASPVAFGGAVAGGAAAGGAASGGASVPGGRGGVAAGGGAGSGLGGKGQGGGAGSSTAAGGGSSGSCGPTTHNLYPLGCKFAWGIADPNGSLGGFSYLQFVSYWVDSSISASGTYTTCNGCNWLTRSVASTNLIPAYYAYIIGFLAHANGIVDGNQSGGKKLTTDGAALVKANYNAIVKAYAWYAQQTAKAWPSKPLIWLLEGDFVQLVDSAQSSPMSYAEVGKLAADITCAIKSNMPNAIVAIDHSSWNPNDVTKNYWDAMKDVNYDIVWTTGVGDNNGYIAAGSNSSTYNAATATYSYLHTATGRTILVDTSAGASAASDSWSTAPAAQLNARIAEGVIAANITGSAPSGLQGNISKLSGLNPIPSCQ